jgi:hypothetical protein
MGKFVGGIEIEGICGKEGSCEDGWRDGWIVMNFF